MELAIVEKDGKRFVSADQWQLPQWACITSKQSYPKLILKADELFLITDTLGNISGCLDGEQIQMGLYCHDSRFLSRLELQIEGREPILLSSSADQGFALSVLCSNSRIGDIPPETIGIQREIVLNGGLFEEIEITNYNTKTVNFNLSLSFDADFQDLFEIRGFDRSSHGILLRELPESVGIDDLSALSDLKTDTITLAYQGLDNALMESRIQFYLNAPNELQGNTAIWHLSLESHETKRIGYRLSLFTDNASTVATTTPATLGQAKAANLLDEQEWRDRVTQMETDNDIFDRLIQRATQDVYLLRQNFEGDKVLSAGIPWFSTLFGRDSIIAASQCLILDPGIAKATLQILANYQGKNYDDWRDEQPGKILHELRLGEMARCNEVPHTPYYGTVDATPLWLMLYAEYYAWTNDRATLEQLWNNALAAMDWIDRQCAHTGYLFYDRKSKRGLANQGWKDSENCVVDRQGELAQGAIALCEVQAYVYSAKIRLAHIARMKKRLDLADRWEEEARELQHRFNRDFWLPEQGFCALALDGDGQPVDSITSNPGHCLGSGILTPDKAASVAERLQAPDMFSGWGVRTLSSDSPAYNPMGYHIGSVWPHDNAIIAWGLRSIGLVEPALEIAQGLIDMAIEQPYYRPPELFCGYERLKGTPPVQYPVACSPQAWATGSLFQLLTMMLHLVPDAPNNCLRILDPMLPEFLDHLSVHNLKIGSTVLDLEFERSGNTTACRMVKKRGNLRVIIET